VFCKSFTFTTVEQTISLSVVTRALNAEAAAMKKTYKELDALHKHLE